MTHEQAAAEFTQRVQGERDKAIEKYGAQAVLPGGAPEREVHDYAINELVGLIRYAEMIQARGVEKLPNHADNRLRVNEIALNMRVVARHLGIELIRLRADLAERGLLYGEPERR